MLGPGRMGLSIYSVVGTGVVDTWVVGTCGNETQGRGHVG